MSALQELLTIGEKMGLKDKALQDFVTQQQTIARDEREKERQNQKEMEDMKAKREAEKINQQLTLSQEANRKLELEIKLKELEDKKSKEGSSHEDGNGTSSGGGGGFTGNAKQRGPKMAPYDDRDDMDSYIFRFERYAELQGWPDTDWAVYLSALLRGKALDVYARLTADESKDYQTLKGALLRRYQMTEEGYKRRFYTAKADVGESPPQFITRLAKYLIRWIELAEIEETYTAVCSLFVREQYLSTCSKDLEMFLRERAITDLTELGKLAEQYEDAHHTAAGTKRAGKSIEVKSTEELAAKSDSANPVQVPERRGRGSGCYVCGKLGHIAKNCFQRMKAGAMTQSFSSQRTWQNRSYNRNYGGNNTEASGPSHTTQDNNITVYCKAHQRQNCVDCLDLTSPPNGHTGCALLASDTPRPELTLECGCKVPVVADACNTVRSGRTNMPVSHGWVDGKSVSVLRDTGCSAVVVRRDLVKDCQLTGGSTLCILIDGTARRVPTAIIDVDTAYYKGSVEALCMKRPLYDLILGNISGVSDKPELDIPVDRKKPEDGWASELNSAELQGVMTRAQASKETKDRPLNVTEFINCEVTSAEIVEMQKQDKTLQSLWQKLDEPTSDDRGTTSFEQKRNLLYRRRRSHGGQCTLQMVVPEKLREMVLKLGHDCIMSGHQGIKKTYDRVAAHFFWPGLHGDVTRYCRSCDICQRTVAKGRVAKVPLGSMPLIETPFQRVAVDLVGPIAPATDRGNRYILTLVDYATRYPEASALRNIEAETVAEALVTMFTRVGVPAEILSDQGSQFMSSVMKEMSRLLSMTQLVTTPYHPMCNGLVERFNGTLKSMLKRMCAERPKDWDRYIPALLFAYREAPQESLGFAPFELLYGRTIRGPMAILKEIWSKTETTPEVKSTYQYVIDLQNRLQETCEMARDALARTQITQKRHFDVKARDREFHPGDKVLLLLPTDDNKLLMQWKGPFDVVERLNGHNYRIQLPGRVRLFHANMLKRYTERVCAMCAAAEMTGAAVVEYEEEDHGSLINYATEQQETYRDVKVNPELSEEQQHQVRELIVEFKDIFTDVPKVTHLGEHSILLTSREPIRSKAYPLPYAMREMVDKELDTMLQMGIIEPSNAAFASPIVMVRKPDGSNRVCVDYRKVNKVTVFDPEPMPRMEDIFAELAGSNYFSKFDFSKGYWQVPMKIDDRDITTFVTHRGLFRFTVMPFGLVNAPATFSRIMRKLLDQLRSLKNYLDDVLAHSKSWPEHIASLQEFFQRVREANLVLRPTKCFVGFQSLTFLGHKLGSQGLRPTSEMLEKIERAPSPTTKKQLRSFLGLVGYYRTFVPNFAAIAVPLTDLTGKGSANQLVWGTLSRRHSPL